MSSNIFFTSERLTPERLSWLAELVKFYSIKIHPESLYHKSRIQPPPFTFYLLGDACYAFIDRQHRYLWEDMFKLPAFRCVFDSRELTLRGIHIEPFKMRFPGQVISTPDDNSEKSVWDLLIDATKDRSISSAFGFLLLQPPYSYHSCSNVLDLFRTAVSNGISPEMYAYLDGVHAMHSNQVPIDHENIGESLTEINKVTITRGLFPKNLIHSQSATSRGYSTFIGENGNIISNCIIPPGKITNLDQIVFRFRKNHNILSHTSFSIKMNPKLIITQSSSFRDPPPLVILATRSPYGTEYTIGAITLAVACAHWGISTRCVFIEDGIHAISGEHFQEGDYPHFDIQAVIQSTSDLDNLEYYYYSPSLSARGLSVNPVLTNVLKIDPSEFARIVLQPPGYVEASHQRVLVF
jgi:tRNA 2-thiouridine synthesizing protein C